jgi:Transposase, Mutator family
LVVKIRESGHVRNKAIYVVIGVNMQGTKEVLGLWASPAGNDGDGAKFWRASPAAHWAADKKARSAVKFSSSSIDSMVRIRVLILRFE